MTIGLCGHYCAGRAVRGVCRPCYCKLYKLVKAGVTTLADLEKQGKLAPPKTNAQKCVKFGRQVR